MLTAWGLVPARGGSKSIPLKNLALVRGRPLLDYGVLAARASGRLSRIVCSTDSERIGERALALGIEVDRRPDHLATDEAKVDAVARDMLERAAAAGAALPDVLVLVQPTSPFLLPEHVGLVLAALEEDPAVHSAHTVAAVPHNQHCWNQRLLDGTGRVTFPYLEERRRARNKQEKPKYFVFGNLIAARVPALLAGEGFYAEPVAAREIAPPYEFDLDAPVDLMVADALIATKAVVLPHIGELE